MITRSIAVAKAARNRTIRHYRTPQYCCNNASCILSSNRVHLTTKWFYTNNFSSTREYIPSKHTKKKEIRKDHFAVSKQGLIYREAEMQGMISNVDTSKISYLQVQFDETFAQTLYDITINIKRKLESSFPIMHKPDLLSPEEYNDPTTKKMPLYIQPRSIEELSKGICLFYGSTTLMDIPHQISDEEIRTFHRRLVLRLEESGFLHSNAKLSEDNIAHADDFYVTLMVTHNNPQILETFPNTTKHLLIANVQASVGMYKLYDDIQIIANRIPSLQHTIVHRNNGQLKRSRRPVWIPQIVLADIHNGMEGCKKEERTLFNICKNVKLHEEIEHLNFQPTGITLHGYRHATVQPPPSSTTITAPEKSTTTTTTAMNWDFTLERLKNTQRPVLPEWVDNWWRQDGDM